MDTQTSIIITSISGPNRVMRSINDAARLQDWTFVIVGDAKSPADFELPGATFLSLQAQLDGPGRFAKLCPRNHYARKNVGYLHAIRSGCKLIIETDDDNIPREGFYADRHRHVDVPVVEQADWVNVYHYFTDATIWPRGLPLDAVQDSPPAWQDLPTRRIDCPIQQGLADENPDVDAVYRLALPLPQNFRSDRRVGLADGTWCPFNSQNTTWWPDAWPLLYLPAYCSFRMTDIWRSFIAQRIAWTNGWGVLFHEPTVYQERNEHDLMRDFQDEIPGYMNNRRIARILDALPLKAGPEHIPPNMLMCYEALIQNGLIGPEEMSLLGAWLADLAPWHEPATATRAQEQRHVS